MKIAVPSTVNNTVDEHFGHCSMYFIYEIDKTGKIISKTKQNSPQGCGCKSNIASILANAGVSLMLAGGIGEGAIQVLKNTGIDVIRGCSGNVDEVVKDFCNGILTDNGYSCQHHEGHNCHH